MPRRGEGVLDIFQNELSDDFRVAAEMRGVNFCVCAKVVCAFLPFL